MLTRIDTELVKRDHPVEEVIACYGIELHHCGRVLVGRCPFHVDRGRPNLYVYPASRSWYCFRCAIGGDVISFVERIEGIGFRKAVAHLTGEQHSLRMVRPSPRIRKKTYAAKITTWGPDERACLAAAVEFYHNQLLTEPAAIAYVDGRGLDRATIESCRVGYASGEGLAAYLRWRRLPIPAAIRVGLLTRDGKEFLAGRIVVPEIRAAQPIWLIGRALEPNNTGPKYLGLPGRKPLLGWEAAIASPTVYLVEGIFDWLTLRCWGYPGLALVGTHARAEVLRGLARFERIYLVLDSDEAGRVATSELMRILGSRAVPVILPSAKDVAELALRRDGRDIFAHALRPWEHALAA